jgi:AbrB family looped-hinge helix DNA binding protein
MDRGAAPAPIYRRELTFVLPSLTYRVMATTRLSSKGQIILPKAVRDSHHWAPGTDFSVEDTGDGVLLRPLKTAQPTRLDDVVGCLRVKGRARTIKEMDAAIGREVRARRDRGRY